MDANGENNNEVEVTETNEETLEAIEETDSEGAERALKDKVKDLRSKLQAAQEEKRELLETLQRTKAEFLNSKQRLEAEQNARVARAEDAFVKELLPLADSFTMAMRDSAAWEAIDEAWRTGVEAIYAQLERILANHNVQVINPIDQPFDPNRHEAVSTHVKEGSKSDVVLEVVQLGYERDGTVLRPAKVVIST